MNISSVITCNKGVDIKTLSFVFFNICFCDSSAQRHQIFKIRVPNPSYIMGDKDKNLKVLVTLSPAITNNHEKLLSGRPRLALRYV